MKKSTFAIVAVVLASSFSAVAAEAKVTEFIRVAEDAGAARLQTSVTRYEKDGATVDLLGAIHIADKAYYENLSKRFQTYDKLLFEMIGGEKFAKGENTDKEPEATPATGEKTPEKKEEKNLSGLHQIYGIVARFLKLTGQTEEIDYTSKNFVHADLTLAEFNKMQKERGESLLGFALKAGKNIPEQSKQPDPAKLLTALLSGKSNVVKLEIVNTLGQGDDQIAAFAGESVIITDRNRRCLEVMDREFAAGVYNLGIFYGAAHFPDMEKRLMEKGFKRVKQDWLTAWDIPKEQAKPVEEKKKDPARKSLKEAA